MTINLNENTQKNADQDKNNGRSIIINRYDGNTSAIFHNNSCFAIIYIADGHYTQNIGLNRLNLQRGDIILLSPNVIYTFEILSDDSVMFELLLKYDNFYEMFAPLMKGNHIFNKFFSEGLHDKTPIKYLLFHTGDDNFLRESILQMFDDQIHQDVYTDQFLTGHLIIGSVYLMRNYGSDVEISISYRSNLPNEFLVMSYIQENIATISLADVAKHFNFSMSHCSRLIKSSTGHGFSEWKRILRLRRARYLLVNTDYNITEIANSLGYQNLENFIRTFQKEFHLTPVQYRRQSKKHRSESHETQ